MSMGSETSRQQEHSDAAAVSPLETLIGAEAVRDLQPDGINNDGLSAREMPAGNVYSGLTIGGQTRAVLGNIFNTTHNHVTNTIERTAEEERHESLMNTLGFDRMDFRKATVDPAHTRTCQWIFQEEAFLKWRDPRFREANHGFFWIKGKPGSGKSTLMKCILDHMTKHEPKCKVISFFFNARGENLERSTEGCYRSLLHQMLSAFPELRSSIQIPHSLGKGHASSIAMLQNIFYEAVLSLQQERLVVMIDALDECDQKEVRSMVQFLGSLAEATELQGVSFNTCFASRHYPSITVRFCETLVVEQSKGHTQDILIYARDSLAINSDAQLAKILGQVMRKAEGVFLWVVLVVRILNEQFDKGQHHNQLLDAISDLPDDLDALIDSIISGGASDPEMVPTLIWILSKSRYMTHNELFAGIKLMAGETASFHATESVELSAMERFVVNASKGLVECRERPGFLGGTASPFRFIHESVRQHLLAGGLQKLKPTCSLATNVRTNCDQILADLCGANLRRCHADLVHLPNNPTTSEQMQSFHHDSGANGARLPMDTAFLGCARRDILIHLTRAYVDKAFDVKRFHDFPLQEYIFFSNDSSSDEPLEPSASLLHVLLDLAVGEREVKVTSDLVRDLFKHCSNCSSIVQNGRVSMSCSRFIIGQDLNDYCGGKRGTPLIAAVQLADESIVEQLLNAGADVNVSSGGKGPRSCREKDTCSPLSFAVWIPDDDTDTGIIRLLLDRGADTNIRGRSGSSALGLATFVGYKSIIKLLLERGADVNMEDSEGCNIALKEAVSRRNHTEIIDMLVRAGAYAKVGSMDHVEFKTPYRFY